MISLVSFISKDRLISILCFALLGFILMNPAKSFAEQLSTPFNADLVSAGNMFDIRALNDLIITEFAGNYSDGSYTVEIWDRVGPYAGFTSSSAGWTKLTTVSLTSAGSDLPSPIPATLAIKVPKNATHAFYISAQTSGQEYTTGTSLGAVLTEDSHIKIFQGAGIGYPFAATFEPRNWNGRIVYTPILTPPTLSAPSNISVDEDSSISTNVTFSDVFYDVNLLNISIASSNDLVIPATNITMSGSGGTRTLSFVPLPEKFGTSTISVTVTTPSGRTITKTFLLTVNPINDLPVALSATVLTSEDVSVATFLGASDSDDATLNYVIDQMPAHGMLSGTAPNLSYHPDTNYFGSDSFVFHATDSEGSSNSATFSIEIAAVNDLPSAENISISTEEDTAVSLHLLGQDADGDSIIYSVISSPLHGLLSGTAPNLIYTPNANYYGTDSFTYRTSDSVGNSALATVSIVVSSHNDAPYFVSPTPSEGKSFSLSDGQLVSIAFALVDPDGDSLTKTITGLPTGARFNPPTGVLTWTPKYSDVGEHRIVIHVSDSQVSIHREIKILVRVIDNDHDLLPDNWEIPNGLSPTSADSDHDQISDIEEVGGNLRMPLDSDGDGILDAIDSDSDNDGISDRDEAGDLLMTSPAVDTDNDGLPDYRDTDSDNDRIEDNLDNCHVIENLSQLDFDQDQLGDVCDEDIDGDGISNFLEISYGMNEKSKDSDGDTILDIFEIVDINSPQDFEGDGIIDALDLDSDNDGIEDAIEAGDAVLSTDPLDTDGDNAPDYIDVDSDNDSVNDDIDNCVLVVNPDQSDEDADGHGDACDEDIDGDGLADGVDNCPRKKNPEQNDFDGDGLGDVCDPDYDGDGVDDAEDNCPQLTNPEQKDLDQDQIGDACDDDADGDDVIDVHDNCLALSNGDQSDLDEDGVGDLCDSDKDGDGIENAEDNCPQLKNPDPKDLDKDKVGDLCDEDRDGDSISNQEDNCPNLKNENQYDLDGDKIGDVCDEKDDSQKEELCGDGFDEDHDGLIDCQDPDCAAFCEGETIFEPSVESEACACRIQGNRSVPPVFLLVVLVMIFGIRRRSA